MIISIIAAMGEQREIGMENRLPWRLPADMQWFRRHTLGKPVLMGRNTFESIGKPLPGRRNIILTRERDYRVEGAQVVHHLEEAIGSADGAPELMVIGGAALYEQVLPMADRLYLTLVHARFPADSWFPDFGKSQWKQLERTERPADGDNPYACSFIILERAEVSHDSR